MPPRPFVSRVSGQHDGVDVVTRYLVVRDADGAILAAFDSPAEALRGLLRDDGQLRGPGVSLVRYDDRQGEMLATTSFVRVRTANLGRPG